MVRRETIIGRMGGEGSREEQGTRKLYITGETETI